MCGYCDESLLGPCVACRTAAVIEKDRAQKCLFRVGDVCYVRRAPLRAPFTIIAISKDEMVGQCDQKYTTFDLQGYSGIGFCLDPPKRTRAEVRWVAIEKATPNGASRVMTEPFFDKHWLGHEECERYMWQRVTFEVPV